MKRGKGDVGKKLAIFSLVVLMIFGLMAMVGCGNGGGSGGGGAGGTTPQTFTTSNMFPLTSGWETDRWTLFVDVVDHNINGVMTKAMVDTRGPVVYFWTNDSEGLRLHGVMDNEGTMHEFSDPIVFADSICKVGDKKEGTYTLDGENYNYTIELVGVEDVTIPAGAFPNCLKSTIFIYPSTELPNAYGYETFWLAENVGLVKAEADENADSELFVDGGDRRQLLSYHITDPAGLSAEEQAVKEAAITINNLFNKEDLAGVMAKLSDDYFDRRCRDKSTLETNWGDFLSNYSGHLWFMTIENIEIDGVDAYVLREGLGSEINDANGERSWSWSRQTRRFRLENGEWKLYGAQLGFRDEWVDVWIRNNYYSDPQEFLALDAELLDCATGEYIAQNVLSSLTITGPPGTSIDPDLWQDYLAEGVFWREEHLVNSANGFYTFEIVKPDGDYFIHTDYLETTPPMDLAALVSPAADEIVPLGDVTFNWNPVANAEGYRVDIQQWDGVSWAGMIRVYLNTPDETSVTVSLSPGTYHRWRVRARQWDLYGNMDNESRTEWREFETGAG